MASREQWENARKLADQIRENFKGKLVKVANYFEGLDEPEIFVCKVIQVNPCESFDDKDKFDFYVVVSDTSGKNIYEQAFLLEKIKDWLY